MKASRNEMQKKRSGSQMLAKKPAEKSVPFRTWLRKWLSDESKRSDALDD